MKLLYLVNEIATTVLFIMILIPLFYLDCQALTISYCFMGQVNQCNVIMELCLPY